MIESGYYPPGAEFDPNAPWNQVENPEEEFEVTVVQTLSKPVTIYTSNYILEKEEDEDGVYRNIDTSETNWEDVYESDHHTPEQLIKMLKRVLEMQLKGETISKSLAKHLIEECDDWVVDDYEIIEE